MKKIVVLTWGILFLALLSCDKVMRPIVVKDTVVGSKFITKSNQSVSNSKKVFFEEYTGQRCANCPDGARIVKNTLIPQYGDNLIVVAVHQGNLFAKPFGRYTNDFRTIAGETWGGSSAGFGIDQWPTALINRKNYASNGLKLAKSKWTSVVPLAMNDPFVVKLDLKTEYDTTVRALNTYIKATFKTSYPNSVKLVAIYMEDGIIGLQDDNGVEDEEYEFEHMLRGDINGTWGTELKAGPVSANDSVSVSFPNFSLPQNALTINNTAGHSINDKHVSVVVFAYDAVTLEVLQAEKVKIR